MCKYCEKGEEIETNIPCLWSHIDKNNLILDYSDNEYNEYYKESIKINYCPFCGKKLN